MTALVARDWRRRFVCGSSRTAPEVCFHEISRDSIASRNENLEDPAAEIWKAVQAVLSGGASTLSFDQDANTPRPLLTARKITVIICRLAGRLCRIYRRPPSAVSRRQSLRRDVMQVRRDIVMSAH